MKESPKLRKIEQTDAVIGAVALTWAQTLPFIRLIPHNTLMRCLMERDDNLETLLKLREQFRRSRPDLDLPPARKQQQAAPSDDDLRKELLKQKQQELRSVAKDEPATFIRMVRGFLNKKK